MSSRDPLSNESTADERQSGEEVEPGERWGKNQALTRDADLKKDRQNRWDHKYDEAAVKQDLIVCLLTPKGDDPLVPEYGLDRFEAVGTTRTDFMGLKAAIIDAIGPDTDPRVRRLTRIDVNQPQPGNRENTEVEVEVQLTDGTILDFVFQPYLAERTRF